MNTGKQVRRKNLGTDPLYHYVGVQFAYKNIFFQDDDRVPIKTRKGNN
jgi:hypothetical protein